VKAAFQRRHDTDRFLHDSVEEPVRSGVKSRTTASTELKLGRAAPAGAGRSPRATAFISSRKDRRLRTL
jgi:hypothetical protein